MFTVSGMGLALASALAGWALASMYNDIRARQAAVAAEVAGRECVLCSMGAVWGPAWEGELAG